MVDKTDFNTLLKEYIATLESFQARFKALKKRVSNRSAIKMPQPADQDISIPDSESGLSEALFDGYGTAPDYHDNPNTNTGNNGIWQSDFDTK